MTARYTQLETVVLEHAASDSHVVIAPSRGAIVTRFCARGREVLFLDEATLVDTTKNVRGGIPVLFPSPGALAGDRFERAGKRGAMKQHGVARNMAAALQPGATATSATLVLAADDATRAAFPWDFKLTLRFSLEVHVADVRLVIGQRIENHSDTRMPFAMGFHPYFAVPVADKARARVPTTATRAFDNVPKREVDLKGPIDLTRGEVDLHLVDHARSDATLELGDGRAVRIEASSAYRRWVIWTLPEKDFVCLEPWTAPGNALNTGAGLLDVEPGASHDLTTSFEVA